MNSEANPVADCVSESGSASPTVNELIFQLRASFFPLEFEHAVKMLRDREEYMKHKHLDLEKANEGLRDELKKKETEIENVMNLNAEVMAQFRVYEKQVSDVFELRKKSEEEKDSLVSENLKLNNELKTKQTLIDAVKMVNVEKGIKIRDYEKRYLDDLEVKRKAEEENQLLILKLNDALKTKRNGKVKAEYESFKLKAEEEKKLLVLENIRLTGELKSKANDIDAVMKVNAEYEGKIKDYEKQSLELKMKTEAMAHANLKLNEELERKQRDFDAMMKRNSEYESKIRAFENKSLESDAKVSSSGKIVMDTDCAAESSRKVSEHEGPKRKIEHNLHEIIVIDDDDDDDDDDDLESLSRTKRRHVCNEKTEFKYSSRLYNSEDHEKRSKQ